MTSINRNGNPIGLGGDLEGLIANVLADVSNTATQLARDVVDTIKTNNEELKLLREMRAALRAKDMGKLNALLDANPEIKGEFTQLMGGSIPQGTTRTEVVERDRGFFGNIGHQIGVSLGLIDEETRTVTDPPSDEDLDRMDSAFDDIIQSRNAFGQEQQVSLQDVLSKVTQSVQANSQISSRFDTLANTILGNLRG